MGRRKVLIDKKTEKSLMKIDPSGRLLAGVYAIALIIIGVLFLEVEKFLGILFLIPSFLLIIWIIIITVFKKKR